MPATADLEIDYRADLDLLTIRWHHDADLPDLQADYEQVLTAAQTHGATRWLLDVRRRDTLTGEAADWIVNHWLPQAVAAMEPARLRLAYFISPLREQFLQTSPMQPIVREALSGIQFYEMALFRDELEAVHWLLA